MDVPWVSSLLIFFMVVGVAFVASKVFSAISWIISSLVDWLEDE